MTQIIEALMAFIKARVPPLYPTVSDSPLHVNFDLVVGLQLTHGILTTLLEPLLAIFVEALETYLKNQPFGEELVGVDAWMRDVIGPELRALADKIVAEAPKHWPTTTVRFEGDTGSQGSTGQLKGKGKEPVGNDSGPTSSSRVAQLIGS